MQLAPRNPYPCQVAPLGRLQRACTAVLAAHDPKGCQLYLRGSWSVVATLIECRLRSCATFCHWAHTMSCMRSHYAVRMLAACLHVSCYCTNPECAAVRSC
jgi:hypothetical protein